MDVRQARPTDAPLVLALALDEGSHLVRGTDCPDAGPTLRTILDTLLPIARPGRVWIAEGDSCAALLEARPRRYVIGWDITRLAVHGWDDDVLAGAVLAAADYVQQRGIPRLFARCGDLGLQALRPLDFRPLVREYVLSGSGPRPPGRTTLPPGSRYRMPQDSWPLHQLASAITPPLLHQLEGSTSLEWLDQPGKLTEIVVERDSQILAWVGWHVRPRHGSVSLGLMVHPDHADLAPDLLSYALDQSGQCRQFVARVREYQERALQAFVEAGLQIAAQETIVVRHGVLLAEPARRRVRAVNIPTIPVSPMVRGVQMQLPPCSIDIYRRKVQGDRCTRGSY